MHRGLVSSFIGRLGSKLLLVAGLLLAPAGVRAQDEPAPAPAAEEPAVAEPAAQEEAPERAAVPEAAAEESKPGPQGPTLPEAAARAQAARAEAAPGGGEPQHGFDGLFSSRDALGFDGNIEIDVGYARFTYDNPNWSKETIYDFRGRFVLGPVLEHRFGHDNFFRATGQFVAWIRELTDKYQFNVDDVYAQVGQYDTWDLKLGRFETWDVFHRGLGFDVYTLEDTGAQLGGTLYDDGQFGPYPYEVNWIFRRDELGRAAVHYYPIAKMLGFEGAVAYGSNALDNSAGGRFAFNMDLDFVVLSAGIEHRFWRRTEQPTAVVNNVAVECDDCYKRDSTGYGGSAVLKLRPVEIGFNVAQTRYDAHQPDGQFDLAGSFDKTTFGGYLQVDPGWLLFRRSLILGIGANRTEVIPDNNDFFRHDRAAAYIAYPLGFNDAMVKLVFSTAELMIENDTGMGQYLTYTNKLAAVRTRVSYKF